MVNKEMLLEDLKAVLSEAKSMGCTEVRRFEHIQLEKIELIVNALEKQIAKKVKYRQGVMYEYCPACDYAHLYSNSEYCHECGQKVEIEME